MKSVCFSMLIYKKRIRNVSSLCNKSWRIRTDICRHLNSSQIKKIFNKLEFSVKRSVQKTICQIIVHRGLWLLFFAFLRAYEFRVKATNNASLAIIRFAIIFNKNRSGCTDRQIFLQYLIKLGEYATFESILQICTRLHHQTRLPARLNSLSLLKEGNRKEPIHVCKRTHERTHIKKSIRKV